MVQLLSSSLSCYPVLSGTIQFSLGEDLSCEFQLTPFPLSKGVEIGQREQTLSQPPATLPHPHPPVRKGTSTGIQTRSNSLPALPLPTLGRGPAQGLKKGAAVAASPPAACNRRHQHRSFLLQPGCHVPPGSVPGILGKWQLAHVLSKKPLDNVKHYDLSYRLSPTISDMPPPPGLREHDCKPSPSGHVGKCPANAQRQEREKLRIIVWVEGYRRNLIRIPGLCPSSNSSSSSNNSSSMRTSSSSLHES